ncbi:MAG TPA: DUF5706 domain-containing protein [Saprospiraceae bacterium]|nr:DUF5706 domain-containing protein [Saprospiraceae bacterium]HMQ83063.1 DUF5706 domain-containing protein [Saprospiraceae bacterium]
MQAQKGITQLAEAYVLDLLRTQLKEEHRYHSLNHTLAVKDAALKLAQLESIGEEQTELVYLAALFHDAGFCETYEGHEAVSRQLAASFLKDHQYPIDKTEKVLALIEVTYPLKEPANLLEQIIKDADLNNLGSPQYMEHLKNLRYEWAFFLNKIYSDDEWLKMNHKFVKNHQYYTQSARALYGEQWEINRKHLKALKDESEKSAPDKTTIPAINDSKSAQMMFKTALRNHLDLSSLADNKANIMLSINALIITIVIPLASSYVSKNMYLAIPVGLLLLTCLISMIFATLATRPIKMTGYTHQAQIENGQSNLFFFGNFYKMTYREYQDGMYKVITKEEILDDSIMRDLFFLGKSLGKKYSQLRICYNIFMYGVIITVLSFGITLMLQPA